MKETTKPKASVKINWRIIVIPAIAVPLVGIILLILLYVGFLIEHDLLIPKQRIAPPIPQKVETNEIREQQPQEQDLQNWQTYRNEEFGFEVRYPNDWNYFESDIFGDLVINLYKTQQLAKPPFTHFTNGTHVSIFPRGLGTEGQFGKTKPSTISFPMPFENAIDYLLSDSTVWASFISLEFPKQGTKGFIWGAAEVKNLTTSCFRGEKEIPQNECDPLLGDKIVHHGVIDTKDKAVVNQIISTFKFIDEKDSRQLGDAATKEECLAKGGVWQKWGLLQLEYCQIPAKDAGKSCTDQSQCTYGCISETGTVPGKCATYKNTFGCFSIVNNGKAEQTLCVD